MNDFFSRPIPSNAAADFYLSMTEKTANRVDTLAKVVPAALALAVGGGLAGAHYKHVKPRGGGRSEMEIDTEAELARLAAQQENDGKSRPLLLALGRIKHNYAQQAAKTPAAAAALYGVPGAALTATGTHAAMQQLSPLLKKKGLLAGTRLGALLGYR